MNQTVHWLLLVVFVIHLTAFAVLGFRRRQSYYLALVVTFTLLSLSILTGLMAAEWQLGTWPVHLLIRYAGWLAAAVSITWTLTRLLRRRSASPPADKTVRKARP